MTGRRIKVRADHHTALHSTSEHMLQDTVLQDTVLHDTVLHSTSSSDGVSPYGGDRPLLRRIAQQPLSTSQSSKLSGVRSGPHSFGPGAGGTGPPPKSDVRVKIPSAISTTPSSLASAASSQSSASPLNNTARVLIASPTSKSPSPLASPRRRILRHSSGMPSLLLSRLVPLARSQLSRMPLTLQSASPDAS